MHSSVDLDDGANRAIHPAVSVGDGVVSQEHDPRAGLEFEFFFGRQLSTEVAIDDGPRDLRFSRQFLEGLCIDAVRADVGGCESHSSLGDWPASADVVEHSAIR